MKKVSFKEFKMLDLRIGKIINADRLEGSENLLKLQVDFGSEQRQSVSGLAKHYRPQQLIDNKYMFICNLERKRFMGVESQCMIFAAEDDEDNIVLIKPERDISSGSKVR